jgi:hypothetical protein
MKRSTPRALLAELDHPRPDLFRRRVQRRAAVEHEASVGDHVVAGKVE